MDVYLDTNILIDLVEGNEASLSKAADIFQTVDKAGKRLCTSEITIAEIFSHALFMETRKTYERVLFDSDVITLLPVHRDILFEAGFLRTRATRKLSLPDSIHLATAVFADARIVVSRNIRDFRDRLPNGFHLVDESESLAKKLEVVP